VADDLRARPERTKFVAAFSLLGVVAALAIVGTGLLAAGSERGKHVDVASSDISPLPPGPGWIPLGDSSGLQLRVRPQPGWRLVSFRSEFLSLESKRDCYTAWLTTWVERGKPSAAPDRSRVVLGYVLGRDYAVSPQWSGRHSLPFSGVPGGALESFIVFQPQQSAGVMVAPLPHARGTAVIALRGLPDPHRHCGAVEQAHAARNLSLTLEHLSVRSVVSARLGARHAITIRS
jgi:hypothetical protein